MTKNLFISGNPGCGKTTLIKEIHQLFPEKTGGFYTEEILENNTRVGFILKTFEGKSDIFAHKIKRFPHRFKKYFVNIDCLEKIAIPSAQDCISAGKILIIDEIGSMEILSEMFCRKIYEFLNSPNKVLATIRLKSQPFTDEIKKLPNSQILILTRQNYLQTKQKVIDWIKTDF